MKHPLTGVIIGLTALILAVISFPLLCAFALIIGLFGGMTATE